VHSNAIDSMFSDVETADDFPIEKEFA